MNLLPTTEKTSLKKGLRLRFLVVFLFLLSVTFFLGSVMLLPSYFLALANISETKIVDDSLAIKDREDFGEILNLPAKVNAKLLIFQSNLSKQTVLSVLDKAINSMPSGVKLSSVSFFRNKDYKSKKGTLVVITGVAQSREPLISFTSILKKDGNFSSVDIPVSNLTKEKNLPFSISLFTESK